jgi:3-deoxy-7-phosphoheptulonate synthase
VFGAMLESHLVEGRQDYVPGRPAVYGQSITDACLSLAQTEPLLEQFARAQQARGAGAGV